MCQLYKNVLKLVHYRRTELMFVLIRFKAVAYMGEEELSTAWDKTKKDARRQAAELAVRGLVANGGFGKFSSLATSVCFSFFFFFS